MGHELALIVDRACADFGGELALIVICQHVLAVVFQRRFFLIEVTIYFSNLILQHSYFCNFVKHDGYISGFPLNVYVMIRLRSWIVT